MILLVEDDKNFRNLLVIGLKRILNCEILVAENGEMGLAKYNAEQSNIDLIITDIEMPKMTGFDMVREIRKNDEKVPVIFITGLFNASANNFINAALLRKPFLVPKLVEVIREISSKYSAWILKLCIIISYSSY